MALQSCRAIVAAFLLFMLPFPLLFCGTSASRTAAVLEWKSLNAWVAEVLEREAGKAVEG